MKKIKRFLSRFLVVVFSCLSVFSVANAAETTSTEVQITIEGQDVATPSDEGDGQNTVTDTEIKTVQTGDSNMTIVYVAGAFAAIAVAVGYMWKRKKNKAFLMMMAMFFSAFFLNHTALAAETTENVSVTVPTTVSISFEEEGTNSISEFGIHNQSLVPITVEKVQVAECNDWKLAKKGDTISVNTKQLVFELEEQCLQAGENAINIAVPENTNKKLNIEVERGAWTSSEITETALELKFEYSLGKKAFQLSFDLNGGKGTIAPMTAYNGDKVTLPKAERDGYAFLGWQDPKGELYTTEYVMPIGDVTLVAQWEKTDAYATYCADDHSLNFYRSVDPIQAGTTYRGKMVSEVFTGFENAKYNWGQAPWYSYRTEIYRIEFHDYIAPINLAHWFLETYYVTYADMEKLDTSQATSMEYMCSKLGIYASELEMKGLEKWDVSKVTNMFLAFSWVGKNSDTVIVGDLSGWNVSNVTTMCRAFSDVGTYASTFKLSGLENWNVGKVTNMSNMFRDTGKADANWSLNLSEWNVSSVEYHIEFNYGVESKVVAPNWTK